MDPYQAGRTKSRVSGRGMYDAGNDTKNNNFKDKDKNKVLPKMTTLCIHSKYLLNLSYDSYDLN